MNNYIYPCRDLPSYINQERLYDLSKKILDLCKEGLCERGFGEEIYLRPLYERVEKRTNPARSMLDRLKNGESINEIIKDYGKVQNMS